jgi:hypothetical protein
MILLFAESFFGLGLGDFDGVSSEDFSNNRKWGLEISAVKKIISVYPLFFFWHIHSDRPLLSVIAVKQKPKVQ